MDTRDASEILNNRQEFQAVSLRRKHPDHRGFCRSDRYGKPTGFEIAKVTKRKANRTTTSNDSSDRSGELVGAATGNRNGGDDPWASTGSGFGGGFGGGEEPPF
ncbi:hypothetical protein AB0M12_37695 [Nocardia vinacea]|uniref:hypothetical protein n=1 Tax=Nocardia vinacea TaxID=96468 RepID=UPI0034410F03